MKDVNNAGTSIANSYDDSVAYAKTLGCVVKLPKGDEVFVDIDSGAAFDEYRTRLLWYRTQCAITEVSVTPSKSGFPHVHIVLRAPHTLTDMEHIAIAALLGSCPNAVLCSLRNAQHFDISPVRFFEKEGV